MLKHPAYSRAARNTVIKKKTNALLTIGEVPVKEEAIGRGTFA
jgi:hypothetical protein